MSEQQRIIFESSPGYILLCAVLAIGCAYLLYRRGSYPWTKAWNNALFVIRAVLSFSLLFLLLGPIVKQINNFFEKPVFIVVYDNSVSVFETTDSVQRDALASNMALTASVLKSNGYEVKAVNLDGKDTDKPTYSASVSDLSGALKRVTSRFESNLVGGVILVSDGIYNEGVSPLYNTYPFPVYTIGIGDTVQRTDVFLKDIAYNKIVYQGNKFPLRVSVMVKNLDNESIKVSVSQRGKIIDQQTKESVRDQLLIFDFQPLAEDQGIQKLDIQVDVKPGEFNTVNNRASVFIEVVEGKKKILMVAGAPHPDIKAIREVVDKNPNYEFLLHIPGIEEQTGEALNPDKVDLAIFHQAPDLRGKTREVFQQFASSKTSLFLITGSQTDLEMLSKQNMPLSFEAPPRDYDEVLPVANPMFSHFVISPESNTIMLEYPPVSIPFGKLKVPPDAMPLLYQRVGSVVTEKPLMYVQESDGRRIGVLLGEGIWRWKLNEFDRFENTVAFDELFGKLLQFLSTADEKRKFRSYPTKQEFSDTEAVVFESQVYNDIFEPVYGNTVDIELTGDDGKKQAYTYTTNPGNIRYEIGGLKEGVYRYKSSTRINLQEEAVRGEFAVVKRQAELQNLTADFDLLRKLATNTGGTFHTLAGFSGLESAITQKPVKSIIHSEESYSSLVNLKWVFWILLLTISVEWFARKYYGSY